MSHFSLIWGNNFFKAAKADGGFKLWAEKGASKIGDLYVNNEMLTFNQICEIYSIPTKHFYKYLQLRHFMSSKFTNIMVEPPLSYLENIILSNLHGQKKISLFYKMLRLHDKESSEDKLEAWRQDTQENIDVADWEKTCLNTTMRLLQYKWLMKTYVTPVTLHKWSPGIPDTCNKCLHDKGTLFHCLWDCWKVENYWKCVVQTLSTIVGIKVPNQATLCILGMYPKDLVLKKNQAIE